MIANVFVAILGILIFLFLFWKRLKEDYAPDIIFKSATYILIGIGIGWIFTLRFFPSWFFWGSLFGGTLGLIFAILRSRVKFYETLEAFTMSALPWLGLTFLKDSVMKSSFSSFLAFIAILLMVLIGYYFDTHYKRFGWYKSGRIGFSGLAVAFLIFSVRSAIAISKVTMLSFVGGFEVIVSGVAAITCLLLLFNLGRVKE